MLEVSSATLFRQQQPVQIQLGGYTFAASMCCSFDCSELGVDVGS